ncbi:MAG: hypothetical protein JST80_13495 [Bdellovibrionales bacterium]|nr:hypothetical protein [Bdellovibrionales bacterium]
MLKLLKMVSIVVLFVGLAQGSVVSAYASGTPKALIYKGEGSCKEDCSEVFVDIVKQAGFDPVFVGPEAPKAGAFDDAVVWIQPGGYAGTAMGAMSPVLKTQIKEFIKNGGGYLGFCAGAFVATSKVGTTSTSGLGIFPGGTKLYGKGIDLKTITWNDRQRVIYWEGGPYLRNLPSTVEKIATYPNGAIGAARTTYGNGRVFIAGMHPEAPTWWATSEDLIDTDGLDWDLVIEQLHWAARR